ncbi:uncharacterized protein [Miscanthus floridulus]|uniref:uncharacterized protein n=1 Tax=Miscanthus floridulus TaxID=154761 RepID=UPI00345A0D37
MNCTVLTWIYGTINADLQQSTMLKNPNAHVAWLHLEDEFLGQRESRSLLLSVEFRTAKQGSSSITDFYRHHETTATLRDFGDPVGDRTLVLTLLRGLNGKFRPMVTNIKLRQPFPTFTEARTLLLLEEIDLNDVIADTDAPPTPAPPTLITDSSGSGTRALSGRSGGAPVHGSATGGGQGNRRQPRGRGGKQQQNQQPGTPTAGGPRPPPLLYNTWAGTVQFWPHPQ